MDQEKFVINKDKAKKGFYISLIIGGGLAIAIAFFFMIFNSEGLMNNIRNVVKIIRPFIIGAVIAYILKPTCNAYERLLLKRMQRPTRKRAVKKAAKTANFIAVVLTYVTWVIILGGLLWIAIPQVYQSVSEFIRSVPQYVEAGSKWFTEFKANNPQIAEYADKGVDAAQTWIQSKISDTQFITSVGKAAFQGVVDFVGLLFDIAVGIVISVFFLSGRKTFAKKSKLIIHCLFKEKHANAIIKEFKYADKMFGGFLEGKIIDSTLIAILYFIFAISLGIPYAALLALICGVTNIIPFFGPFLGAIPSGFIILMSGEPWQLFWFIVFVCVIQFIDGNIIDPHIVGGNIQISPFCVIFAVLFFGGLWGFIGLLIGVPTFAVIYDIIKKIIYARLIKTGKKDILKAHLAEFGREPKKDKSSAKGASDDLILDDAEACAESAQSKVEK